MEVDQTLVRRHGELMMQDVIFVGTGMPGERGPGREWREGQREWR